MPLAVYGSNLFLSGWEIVLLATYTQGGEDYYRCWNASAGARLRKIVIVSTDSGSSNNAPCNRIYYNDIYKSPNQYFTVTWVKSVNAQNKAVWTCEFTDKGVNKYWHVILRHVTYGGSCGGASSIEGYELVTAATAPNPPYNVSAVNSFTNGTYKNTISWVDNTNDEDAYYVYRSINSTTNWSQVGSTGANGNSYINDLGASPAWGTYYYKVVAHSAIGLGNSADSNIANVAVTQPPPEAPINLGSNQSIDENGNKVIGLWWTDNSSSETEFRVSQSVNGSAYSEVQILLANATDTIINLGNNPIVGDYSYKVAAVRSGVYSTYSNIETQNIQNSGYSYVIEF